MWLREQCKELLKGKMTLRFNMLSSQLERQ